MSISERDVTAVTEFSTNRRLDFGTRGKAGAIGRLPARPGCREPIGAERRWGIILAGGDGARLRGLTRFISGDERPKQFCALVGSETLLEKTRLRAERSISSRQTVVALLRQHQPFYLSETGIRPRQRIVQPANRGTLPPILYSLLSIEREDPGAIVAILPSDHHYSDERGFDYTLDRAFDVAARQTKSIVIVGAHANTPEVEYGWIEVSGQPDDTDRDVLAVRRFCEKPPKLLAQELLRRGALWNTFVMVGHVRAFLELLEARFLDLVNIFRGSSKWIGTEAHIPDSLYRSLNCLDFSQTVLSALPERLVAVTLSGTEWSDLGHPDRVVNAAEASGVQTEWVPAWRMRRVMVAVAAPAASVVA